MPVEKNVLENLPKELEEKLEKLTNNCEEQFDETEQMEPLEVTPTHHEVTSEPMPDRMKPVYFTIKELEALYRKHKITFKELELYRHCPHKIPVKTWEALPEHPDTFTKTTEMKEDNSTKTI